MAGREVDARPAGDRPAIDSTVPSLTDIEREQRRAAYRAKEHPKYVRALDRHIERCYGGRR
jgi:hypothetical protein